MEAADLPQRELLAAARIGDEAAFERLIARQRRELHAHCYRMLGSTHDAEDALRESLFAAWRGLEGFEGRSSLRAWLYRICTNACLRAIEQRPKRVLTPDYGRRRRRRRISATRSSSRSGSSRGSTRSLLATLWTAILRSTSSSARVSSSRSSRPSSICPARSARCSSCARCWATRRPRWRRCSRRRPGRSQRDAACPAGHRRARPGTLAAG
jgi:RNA polymerase sigma factor (sigma-70 family)